MTSVSVARPHAVFSEPRGVKAQQKAHGCVPVTLWEVGHSGDWRPGLERIPHCGLFPLLRNLCAEVHPLWSRRPVHLRTACLSNRITQGICLRGDTGRVLSAVPHSPLPQGELGAEPLRLIPTSPVLTVALSSRPPLRLSWKGQLAGKRAEALAGLLFLRTETQPSRPPPY